MNRRILLAAVFAAGIAALVFAFATGRAAESVRGPFVAMVGATEATIVWKTNESAPGSLHWRPAGPTATAWSALDEAPRLQHEVRLAGLSPDTAYQYEVSDDTRKPWLKAALGEGTFHTAPPPGSARPFRVALFGDCGTGSGEQMRVAARLRALEPPPDVVLILGDVIYGDGEAEKFDPRYFRPYGPVAKNVPFWQTIGNRDVHTEDGHPYLDAFALPANNPRATELYYSFDYGNAHFIAVDSQHWLKAQPGHPAAAAEQEPWLRADLERARGASWKFVFFHHSPYSAGSHPDDPKLKKDLVPILESGGADMVFTGHSHGYERSFLLKDGAKLDGAQADYAKTAAGGGTIYLVAGTGGETRPVSQHPLMAFGLGRTAGLAVVDVNAEPGVARGSFVKDDGEVVDPFVLRKR